MGNILLNLKGKVTIRAVLELAILAIVLWLLFVGLNWLGVYLKEDKIRTLISQAGLWGSLLYALIYLVSVVVAPVPGFAAYVVTAGIYGVLKIVFFTYFWHFLGQL